MGQELLDSISSSFLNDTIKFQEAPQDTTIFEISPPFFDDTEIILISDTDELATFFPLQDYSLPQKHSPAKAAMMSAVLPGLGQVYNKMYWKVPIAYAMLGTSSYFFLKLHNDYNRLRRAYIDFKDNDIYTNFHETLGFPSFYTEEMKIQWITKRKEDYRTWRDWSIAAIVISYAMIIIDANVDAHLMDFSLDDNISFNIRPCFWRNSFDSQIFGLSLRLYF